MSAKSPASGYLLVGIAAASWGTWPLILRAAEARAPIPAALESTFVMLLLTAASGALMLRDRVPVKAKARDWLGVGWLGVSDALNILLYFGALQRTSVAVAVLTHYLTPLFVAITAPLLLREKSRASTYVAAALSFFGLVVLLRPWEGSHMGYLGALFGAGSAVFYTSNIVTNKRLVGVFSGSELMFYHGLVSTPVVAAFVPPSTWTHLNAGAMTYVLLGAVGPGALAGLLFVWGLRRVPASHASTLTLLEPLVAVLLAAAALGEPVGLSAGFGALLILAGAALVVSQRSEAASA